MALHVRHKKLGTKSWVVSLEPQTTLCCNRPFSDSAFPPYYYDFIALGESSIATSTAVLGGRKNDDTDDSLPSSSSYTMYLFRDGD
ncbi:hypothetical protein ACA910_016582 [Epithemia clementina (nom. ined.)]